MNRKLERSSARGCKGLALTALMTIIAVFLIIPIVITTYEIIKFNCCQLELKHCVDSAALAAGCGITTSDTGLLTSTEQYAMNESLYIFKQNTILSNSLASATASYATNSGTTTPNVTVGANKSALYFEFIDPDTMNQVGYGGANGKIIRVHGYYGFVPDYFTALKFGNVVCQATAISDGGLPQLDMVLCLDISSSMDDYTNVCLVNRYGKSTDSTTTGNFYDCTAYNGYQIIAENNLYGAVQPSTADSCGVNVSYPMTMDNCPSCAIKANPAGHGVNFDALPPYSQGSSSLSSSTWTDLVVPLDGSTNCAQSVTVNATYFGTPYTYTFPAGNQGIAVLVEAQRVNLENYAYAQNAGLYCDSTHTHALGTPSITGVTIQPGWFACYYMMVYMVMNQQGQAGIQNFPNWGGVMSINSIAIGGSTVTNPTPLRQPIGSAIAASESFFQVLYNDADTHFGLVTFNNAVGAPTNSAGTVSDPTNSAANSGIWYNLYQNAPYTTTTSGGVLPYDGTEPPLPQIVLQTTAGAAGSNFDLNTPPAQYSSVNAALYSYGFVNPATTSPSGLNPYPPYSVVALGGSYIATAINAAVAQFATGQGGSKGSRTGATKAIVLFTDGLPTGPSPDSAASGTYTEALAAAQAANTAGIPVYCIGLCQTPSLQATQSSVLTGIANASGNGATFTQLSSPTQIDAAFQNIARQLISLVQ